VIASLSGSGQNGLAFDSQNGKVVAAFDNEDTSRGQYAVGTVSGTSITFATPVDFNTDGRAKYNSPSFNASVNKVVLAFEDNGNSSYGTAQVLQVLGSNLTSTNFVGLAAGAISDTATGKINVKGSINSKQSSLTIGSDYYVQADGSVSTTSTSPAVKIGQAVNATTINMMNLT
jgi:hypothetical protein